MKEPLTSTELTLFFTGGVGLKTWADVGSLDREAEVYKRLGHYLKGVNFVTYGGRTDRDLAGRLGDIRLLPSTGSRSARLTSLRLLARYGPSLVRSDVFKTNQIKGSDVAIWLKKKLKKEVITLLTQKQDKLFLLNQFKLWS